MPKKTSENPKWYATGLHFECTQCGNCCSGVPGYVWVSDDEAKAIAEHLNIPLEVFYEKHLRKVGKKFSFVEKENYDCIFLERKDNGVGCSIYPVRPKQCSTWPFWNWNLENPDDYLENTRRCDGINKGKLYTLKEIEEKLDESPC
jgi:uncharacterized protein